MAVFTAQNLVQAKNRELETEDHMNKLAVQGRDRYRREVAKINQEIYEKRERTAFFEVIACSLKMSKIEVLYEKFGEFKFQRNYGIVEFLNFTPFPHISTWSSVGRI